MVPRSVYRRSDNLLLSRERFRVIRIDPSGGSISHLQKRDLPLSSGWLRRIRRFVESCRRELLDHVIVLNERHLKRLMHDYVRYYHEDRTHLGLAKETPGKRSAEKSAGTGCSVISWPRLGGLHHRYQLAA